MPASNATCVICPDFCRRQLHSVKTGFPFNLPVKIIMLTSRALAGSFQLRPILYHRFLQVCFSDWKSATGNCFPNLEAFPWLDIRLEKSVGDLSATDFGSKAGCIWGKWSAL
jgi:hypothetical protein